QLLARLPARVEGALHLHAAERAIGETSSVFARERDALGDALVDDLRRQLRQAIDVRFLAAIVAPPQRVVEHALLRVTCLAIDLAGVDAPLRRDRMRPAGAVLVA